jgi:hypothetical protein
MDNDDLGQSIQADLWISEFNKMTRDSIPSTAMIIREILKRALMRSNRLQASSTELIQNMHTD